MDIKLEVVVVPVSDVDQLTPPGSGCSVTIGKGIAAMEPGSLKGLQLCVADIDAAHALYTENGVPVTPIRHHDGSGFVDGKGDSEWNSFFFFDDPDGNSWAVQESPTMKAAAAG